VRSIAGCRQRVQQRRPPLGETFGSSRHSCQRLRSSGTCTTVSGPGCGPARGYYRVTGASFLADWTTRSGDETALRLIPFALSLVYKADRIPRLQAGATHPLREDRIGRRGVDGDQHRGQCFSQRVHTRVAHRRGRGARAELPRNGHPQSGCAGRPLCLFFEWDYAAINGLGFGRTLHVGDSTWFAASRSTCNYRVSRSSQRHRRSRWNRSCRSFTLQLPLLSHAVAWMPWGARVST